MYAASLLPELGWNIPTVPSPDKRKTVKKTQQEQEDSARAGHEVVDPERMVGEKPHEKDVSKRRER